jgi:hypothetical protein
MSFIHARLQHEESPKIRARLEKRLSDLWINRDLAIIDAKIADWSATHGKAPTSVDELVKAGLFATPPRDPKGGTYSIIDGRASCALPYEVLRLKR